MFYKSQCPFCAAEELPLLVYLMISFLWRRHAFFTSSSKHEGSMTAAVSSTKKTWPGPLCAPRITQTSQSARSSHLDLVITHTKIHPALMAFESVLCGWSKRPHSRIASGVRDADDHALLHRGTECVTRNDNRKTHNV